MSDTKEKPKAYVAFQGGGVLGLAHIGAWQEIAKHYDIVGTAGTSAGSIIAALCAAGFPPEDAKKLLLDLNWSDFVKTKGFFNKLWWLLMLLWQGAYSDGKRFRNWLKEKLREQADNVDDVTFKELFDKHNIYLAIVACDLNNQEQPFIFDTEEEPKIAVSFAVRASISIPGIFTTVSSDNRSEKFIDGGILMNYPIKLLHKQAEQKNATLIGVRFTKPVKLYPKPNILQVLKGAYDATMRSQDDRLPAEFKNNSTGRYIEISIDVGDMNPLDFQLSDDNKKKLLDNGQWQAKLKIIEARLEETLKSLASWKDRGEPSVTDAVDPKLKIALGWLDARKDIAQSQGMIALDRYYPHLKKDSRNVDLFLLEVEEYLYWIRQAILTQKFQKSERPVSPRYMPNEVYIKTLEIIKCEMSEKLKDDSEKQIRELISYVQEELRINSPEV